MRTSLYKDSERDRLGLLAYDIHALRYWGVMELAWAGCDDDEIAAYSGHANKDMIRKYAGQARQDLRASAQGKAPANRTCTERKPDNRTDNCLRPVLSKSNETTGSASWRSGYAADCKSVYTGSIPGLAGALEIPCHFCKLKKRNDTCEKNLILM